MENRKRIVIALGGNALQSSNGDLSAESQMKVIKETCKHIAQISCNNYEMAIVHGNGPQVGQILQAYEAAKDTLVPMPFDVCGAMSQGYIGYQMQQGLSYALKKRNRHVPVVTIATQMIVDSADPAFQSPTKPIGSFYSEEEAKKLTEEKGYIMKEDSGRGWRRVVASPIPKKIVEINSIKTLWDNTIVIACGGGGVPVVETPEGELEGVAAVIDKDYAAELLAEEVNADILLILTAVEKVCINFNKPNQQELSHLSLKEASRYVEEGHFAPGSMLPKVQAAMKFVRANPGKKAILTSLDKSIEALEGKTGTVFTFA